MDFMVLGLPRSGTAWLANWFTTERSICMHEALMDYSLEDLLAMSVDKVFGVAETSLCLWDVGRINAIPVKKLIVHRELEQVNRSLARIDLPNSMEERNADTLFAVDGVHINFEDLFDYDKFHAAHEWLVPTPFDSGRYALLRKLRVENAYAIRRCKEMIP